MHKLLTRLIRKAGYKEGAADSEEKFLKLLSDAFEHADEDRWMLEHSLNVTSQELIDKNNKLLNKLDDIEEYKRHIEVSLIRQRTILDISKEVIVEFNLEGEITHINQSGCDFIGLCEKEALKLNATEVLHTILPLFKHPDVFIEEIHTMFNSVSESLSGSFETNDGRHYEYYSAPELIKNQCVGRVWYCRDVTELKKQKKMLSIQAHSDSLTGLANRFSIIATIRKLIENKAKTPFSLVLIDLDDFKKINDSLGHLAGDEALKIFANRLTRKVKRPDLLSRLGGDEFLVILKHRPNVDIISRVKSILSSLDDPIAVENHLYQLSLSIGIASYPEHGKQVSEILGKADIAMYEAKKLGKNQYKEFDSELDKLVQNKIYVEGRLNLAIVENRFELHYQPKIDIKSGQIISMEALVRWRDNGTLIYPDEFIPIAEDKGLIGKITDCVLEIACRTLHGWNGIEYFGDLAIAVNISAKDVSNPKFYSNLVNLFEKYDFNKSLLELELTESAVISNLDSVKETLTQLKHAGIKVAIDDFGTGYSSLAYLQALDIDYLKIDRQFIMALLDEPKANAIVQSIIDVGKNLDLCLIAEGVEDKALLDKLMSMGCDQAQGYFVCRPLPYKQLVNFLELHNFNVSSRDDCVY